MTALIAIVGFILSVTYVDQRTLAYGRLRNNLAVAGSLLATGAVVALFS